MSQIILPKPNQKIPAKLINPRNLLFYAEPKLGKTTLLSTLPDSLLLDLEDGSDAADTGARINIQEQARLLGYLDNDSVPKEIGYLKALKKVGDEIIKQGKPYKRIVGDTLTELAEWCLVAGTKNLKDSIIGKNFEGNSCLELPKGGGYYWWRLSYNAYYKYLMTLSDCFVGIAHIKDATLTNKEGKEVDVTDLSLTGQLKQITCAKADAIGYLYRKDAGIGEGGRMNKEIWVSFNASGINVGNRFRRLTYADLFLSKIVNSEDEAITGKWDELFLPEIPK